MPVEREVFIAQLGLILGALANVCHRRLRMSPGEAMLLNLEKLRARFPEKFTTSDALNRDLAAEREILGRHQGGQITHYKRLTRPGSGN